MSLRRDLVVMKIKREGQMNQGLAAAILVGFLGYGVYCYRDGQEIAKKDDAAFVAKNHDYYVSFCKAWPEQECCARNSDECSPAGKRVVSGNK